MKQMFKRVRRALGLPVNREPLPAYAWPGGYPLVYLFTDGGVICPACVNANIDLIDGEMFHERKPVAGQRGGWSLDGVEPNYEDADMNCDNCGKPIPAAYVNDRDDRARA